MKENSSKLSESKKLEKVGGKKEIGKKLIKEQSLALDEQGLLPSPNGNDLFELNLRE